MGGLLYPPSVLPRVCCSVHVTFFGLFGSVALALAAPSAPDILFCPLAARALPAVSAVAAPPATPPTVGAFVGELLFDPAVHNGADLRNVTVLVDLRKVKCMAHIGDS